MDEMKKAMPGDIVSCKGIKATIAEIHEQYWHCLDGCGIEFTDTNGRYRMWKQHADGGRLIRVTSK